MAQCQHWLLTKGTGVKASWEENPRLFLHARLMIKETLLVLRILVMEEMCLMMKEMEKMSLTKNTKMMMQNSISSVRSDRIVTRMVMTNEQLFFASVMK